MYRSYYHYEEPFIANKCTVFEYGDTNEELRTQQQQSKIIFKNQILKFNSQFRKEFATYESISKVVSCVVVKRVSTRTLVAERERERERVETLLTSQNQIFSTDIVFKA